MATSTITITDGASTITLDNTVSTLTLGTSGPQGAPGEGVPVGGTAGQILAKDSATNYDTSWIDNYTTDVRKLVKNDSGGTLAKGTVVYVSGANGANVLVKAALATSDGTSATTIGILNETLANNASGYAIVEGAISGINTSAAAAGDPVWLSGTVAGGMLYGVANKPQAPVHVVYLGTVTRSNINNGQIEISVNNGWELDELHNVLITSPTNGQVLAYNSTTQLWENTSETGDISSVAVTSPITGGGTSGAVTIGFDQAAQNTTNDARYARLGAANAFTVGGHTITNTVAATIPLQITAAASQSANLQEWRNSGGTILGAFEASGTMRAGYMTDAANTSTAAYLQFTTTSIGLFSRSAGNTVTYVRGAASQTGNLQEWQNSSGTVLARVDSFGSIQGRTLKLKNGTSSITGYQASVEIEGASISGMLIKGAAAQTANLQEWQDSAGTLKGYVRNDGLIQSATGLLTTGAFIAANGYIAGTSLSSTAISSTTIGAIIKGAASQTADLQQWQSSGGTVLAKLTSGGVMQAAYFQTPNSYLVAIEENNGGRLRFTKATASASAPGADMMKMYVVAGTNAGTLKLVVRAGAAGAETTVLDNIPQ